MKNFLKHLFLGAAVFVLASCGKSDISSAPEHTLSNSEVVAQPGGFHLTAPAKGITVTEAPAFSWEAASNATYYTLEIASTATFIANDSTVVYYKHDYIAATSFSISASLPQKNVTYYWKVTAHSGSKTQECHDVFTFYLSSIDKDEVKFPLGDTSEWNIHTEGAPVDLSINKDNFFDNQEEAMVCKFTMEQTKPVGWIVLTKTVELDTYGTDALYLRFFYAGDDGVAYVRLRDNDDEFWRAPIRFSPNAKSERILPFKDFTQDTKQVLVNNRTFDYFHIKYIEIVFEQTWGDGVCLFSELKTVKRSHYEQRFIKKLNFKDYPTSEWKWENNYDFGYDISEDGSSYTLHYYNAANGNNAAGIAGYGFAKIYVKRFFDAGDMVKLIVKYTGSAAGKLVFRVYEEDTDLWSIVQPFSALVEGEETTLYVPFKAFAASSLAGNGRREFLYINGLQFGVNNMYGTGTLTFKDIEIVSMKDVAEVDSSSRVVGEDGLIENFENYTYVPEPYYQWQLGTVNKDEYLTLDSIQAFGANNSYAGSFGYKADMQAAQYGMVIKNTVSSRNAVSFLIKDASVKNTDAAFNYINEVSAFCTLTLYDNMAGEYYYQFEALPKFWTKVTIPFAELETASLTPLTGENIAGISFSFSYVYYNQDGTPHPTYTMGSLVYLDDIYLTEATSMSSVQVETPINADKDDATKATIDTFENYASTEDVYARWGYGNTNENNKLELSNDVSPIGGTHSLKMNYKGSASVSYALPMTIDPSYGPDYKPKAVALDIKSDGKATIYVNLYGSLHGSRYQVRKNITASASVEGWGHYVLGLDTFTDYCSPSTAQILASTLSSVYQITFGIVNSDGSESAIYIDNLGLITTGRRADFTATKIA